MGAALLVNLKDIAIHLLEHLARNSYLFIEHFGITQYRLIPKSRERLVRRTDYYVGLASTATGSHGSGAYYVAIRLGLEAY